MGWLPTSILTREARFAYVASALRLTEIYVPFVRHTDAFSGMPLTLLLTEPLLNDVRGNRIAELPKDEQDEWKQLWDEVAKLHDQTALPPAKP